MVAVGGRSLFEYGDLTRLSYLASVRKSVLAMLYGKYVENGTIPLNKTLREMEFTDVGGLMPQELDATIEDLITARSGVYHPASNAGERRQRAAPRTAAARATSLQQLGFQRGRGRLREADGTRDLRCPRDRPRPADRDAGLRPVGAGEERRPRSIAVPRVSHVAFDA
jgi:CubicO group peptidase (beta-lactamase class C family)